MIMGYAIVKGRYHKGPKKNTRKCRCRKPVFDKPAPKAELTGNSVLDDNRDLIAALAQMNDADMRTFLENTTGPNPRGCVLAVDGGTPTARGANAACFPISAGSAGFPKGGRIVGVAPMGEPVRVPAGHGGVGTPVVGVKTEPKEEVIGFIVKKPNGEIVLRFK